MAENKAPKVPEAPVPEAIESISEFDKMNLELAKMNRKVALANAEKALSQNDLADVSYKYVMLQLYMKYGLSTDKDIMDENGIIHRGHLTKKESK